VIIGVINIQCIVLDKTKNHSPICANRRPGKSMSAIALAASRRARMSRSFGVFASHAESTIDLVKAFQAFMPDRLDHLLA
jgi:hypothetical protein